MDTKYQEFIKFLFDHDESKGEWRFDIESEEPEITGEEVVLYVQRMFENYDSDISGFSDWQLGLGLAFIFNNTFSEYSFYLRDGPASIEKRVSAILSLKALFHKCLNGRCAKSLCHLSEKGNELNNFCYMIWDVSPLAYCEDITEKEIIYSAVLEVMEYSLTLDNVACVESGLHGLGHLELYCKKAPKIVKEFIKSNSTSDKRIMQYALNAERGNVL